MFTKKGQSYPDNWRSGLLEFYCNVTAYLKERNHQVEFA